MRRRTHPPVTRNGFTIIELLVSMAIIGLLTALLLPAVQRVRESARNSDCKNRLHQFGIAMHQLEEVHRAFPTSGNTSDRIMLHSKSSGAYRKCPSDHRFDDATSYTSYLFNEGTDVFGWFNPRPGNGFTVQAGGDTDLEASQVTDGLSQTVAVAERLLVPPGDVALLEPELLADPRRYTWHLSGVSLSSVSVSPDAWTNACRNNRTTPYPLLTTTSGVSYNGYTHVMGPNEIACENVEIASSEHPGHVNVLMGDGSVRSVANGIDLTVWRAIGTRNGNETVGEF